MSALTFLVVLDLLYVLSILPDWDSLASGPIPQSRFMQRYELNRQHTPQQPAMRWQPVSIDKISPLLRRAVIVAEDSRFYDHDGVDLQALQQAVAYNIEHDTLAYGASTISQQTVKNLFLSASRTPLRKWHELLLTLSMERHLSKKRILELYLNVAEFGPGIYGAEAAARHYWACSAAQLSLPQAVELAATLPNPTDNNPQTRTSRFNRNTHKILRWMQPQPYEPAS